MHIRQALALSVVTLFASQSFGKDPCVSGPQTGQRPGPYSFLVASGPQRGQQTCYVCETAEKPGIIVFARSLSDPLATLLSKCDSVVDKQPKDTVKAWLTVLGEKTVSLDDLGKWTKQAGLKTMPTGVFDDPVGPPSYKLADEAEVTVLLFKDKKVVANFAYRKGELTAESMKPMTDALGKFLEKK
jgi:hypothetical protein